MRLVSVLMMVGLLSVMGLSSRYFGWELEKGGNSLGGVLDAHQGTSMFLQWTTELSIAGDFDPNPYLQNMAGHPSYFACFWLYYR